MKDLGIAISNHGIFFIGFGKCRHFCYDKRYDVYRIINHDNMYGSPYWFILNTKYRIGFFNTYIK